MASKIYFAPVDQNGVLPPGALKKLFGAAKLGECFESDSFVALKLHFGEPGNLRVFRPEQTREVADAVREQGGLPFLTDANVLYRSKRHNAVEHLEVINSNGFSYDSTGCPVIIADGLRGDNYVELPVPGGKHHKTAKVAGGIAHADAVIALTHVTGHMDFGLAAAIKNLGMGSGSIAGKQMMHDLFRPKVKDEVCVSCGACAEHCQTEAITVPDGSKAVVDEDKCVGCGECVAHCSTGAIKVQWGESLGLQERTVEFCAALMARQPECFGFISLLTNITGSCDCMSADRPSIIDDIGAIAGRDLVAVDQAALDLIGRAPQGREKLEAATPGVQVDYALGVAESMGLGSLDYELVEV